jgi:transcriptional regulator with XRE-family HTH domain
MYEMLTDDDVRTNVAENVRRLLSDRGWSQSELARHTGDTQQVISQICAARQVCGIGLLARIAEAFDVSLDRLVLPAPKRSLANAS